MSARNDARPRPRHPSAKPIGAKPRRKPAALGRKPESNDESHVRLQKLLAAAGIGSRRKCEELITAGRVSVDGRTVTALGTKVDPALADVRVDLEPLPRSHLVYYMVNKPIGVVSTNRDPAGRPRVVDLAPQGQRLFAVGRLDVSSEGLILVTNDGELANLLAHPRYGVEKTYQVQVAGTPSAEVLERLRRGVHLAEGFAHAKRVWIKSLHKQSTILEMVLDEGKNREVRRLLAQVGHKALHLRRTALGPLRLGELPLGECRPLRREEVRALREGATSQATGNREQAIGGRSQGTGDSGSGTGIKGQGTGIKGQETGINGHGNGARRGGEPKERAPVRGGTVIGASAGGGRRRDAAAGGNADNGSAKKPGGGRRKLFQQRQQQQGHGQQGKQQQGQQRQGQQRQGQQRQGQQRPGEKGKARRVSRGGKAPVRQPREPRR